MATVIAKQTCRVAGTGHRAMVVKGKTYDDSDPVVKANPSLFESPDGFAVRESKPTNTEQLGSRSMSARRKTETTTDAPDETRDVQHVCDTCGETAKTRAGLKAHQRSHR